MKEILREKELVRIIQTMILLTILALLTSCEWISANPTIVEKKKVEKPPVNSPITI